MMHKTKDINNNLEVRMLVTTPELQGVLGCGRASAVKIGTAAGARVTIGRRVLWNRSKIERYVEQIAI